MDDLVTALSRRGFDVLAPFRVSWYNEYIQKLGLATDENHVAGSAFTLAPLPNLGQDDALALIVVQAIPLVHHNHQGAATGEDEAE